LTSQRLNKLAAIYRLCDELEIDPTAVLSGITLICDESSREMVIRQGEKLPDSIKEERKEFVDDRHGGS